MDSSVKYREMQTAKAYFAFLTQFISIILRLSDECSQTQAWSVTYQSKDKPSQGREGHF